MCCGQVKGLTKSYSVMCFVSSVLCNREFYYAQFAQVQWKVCPRATL